MNLTLTIAALVLAATLATWGGMFLSQPEPVVQPMAFSHAGHLAEELECEDCHRGANKGAYATLPSVKSCLLCHEEPNGDHPDEPKIREYAEAGEEIPWIPVDRLAGHAYFSHVAHVKYAEMDCEECHEGVKDETKPIAVSGVEALDMAACMDCHARENVTNDCLACHK